MGEKLIEYRCVVVRVYFASIMSGGGGDSKASWEESWGGCSSLAHHSSQFGSDNCRACIVKRTVVGFTVVELTEVELTLVELPLVELREVDQDAS